MNDSGKSSISRHNANVIHFWLSSNKISFTFFKEDQTIQMSYSTHTLENQSNNASDAADAYPAVFLAYLDTNSGLYTLEPSDSFVVQKGPYTYRVKQDNVTGPNIIPVWTRSIFVGPSLFLMRLRIYISKKNDNASIDFRDEMLFHHQ